MLFHGVNCFPPCLIHNLVMITMTFFPNIIFIFFIVPADGVKGKTWGPSSGGQVLNSLGGSGSSKSRPAIPEDRWSKSASSLDKSSSRSKSGLPSVTSVPEIGKKFCEICILVVDFYKGWKNSLNCVPSNIKWYYRLLKERVF